MLIQGLLTQRNIASTRLAGRGNVSNYKRNDPRSEAFTLLNSLSITDDDMLGNYKAWVTNGE